MNLLIVCFVETRERGWVNLIVIFKMPSEKCQSEFCHLPKRSGATNSNSKRGKNQSKKGINKSQTDENGLKNFC